jgi:hypothetical protein
MSLLRHPTAGAQVVGAQVGPPGRQRGSDQPDELVGRLGHPVDIGLVRRQRPERRQASPLQVLGLFRCDRPDLAGVPQQVLKAEHQVRDDAGGAGVQPRAAESPTDRGTFRP